MGKRAILAVLAVLSITILIGGCMLYKALMPDTIEYMGLKYGPSAMVVPPEDMLYYTGVTYGGAGVYAPAHADGMEKVPLKLCLKSGPGEFRAYTMFEGNPPVFAYTAYTRYNLGEPVTIGLMNRAGGQINLSSPAPFEIQKKEGGEWKHVFQPMAAQVITPLENGTYKEWTWEQLYSGDGKIGEGDYRAVINGQYEVYFTITKGAPVVRAEARDYNERDISNSFLNVPEHAAFAEYYQYSGSREDIASEMAFKAWMEGLDADKLHSALKGIMPASGGIEIPSITGDFIPCRAIHISFKGKPAWYIVINWGMGGEKLDHIKHYVIDDETGKIVYYLTCK